MAVKETDFSSVLDESLTERDTELQEEQLPEINVGEAIPIEEDLDPSLEKVEFGVTRVVGSVKDGIIGNKTNSLKTIDSEIEWKEANVGKWAKAQTWTQQELEKTARLGIALDTKKQDDLYANAVATIQYAGYVGHEDIKDQEGLLTSKEVTVKNASVNKTIKDMTSAEFVDLILDAYHTAWRRSGYRIKPTNIAMDAEDFMEAISKFDVNSPIVGTDLLPVSAMDRLLAALKKASEASGGKEVKVKFVMVPSRYARNIIDGKTRLAVYTYDKKLLVMKVYMPELLGARLRNLLTYECGYRSAFSGALWKQPLSGVYVDYKTSAEKVK